MTTVTRPTNAFLTVIYNPNPVRSYVDIKDLAECLQLFYEEKLDEAPQELADTLYLPLHDWYDNTLRGQIDSPLLRRALYSLNEVFSAAIEYHFLPDEELEDILLTYYIHDDQFSGSFHDWQIHLYTLAVERLAAALHKLL